MYSIGIVCLLLPFRLFRGIIQIIPINIFAFLGSFVLSTFIDLSYYYYYYTYMHTTASKKNNNTIYCEFLCTSCLFDTYYNSQEIILIVFLFDNDCIIL
jgi:hypothetical protein